ncbi:MAG: hypothetical protein HN816_14200 [Gammaproteobacteria bacterium]|nr:hypothetical protein [Gammaproteobacteria bacterium]
MFNRPTVWRFLFLLVLSAALPEVGISETPDTLALPPITLARHDDARADIQVDGHLDEEVWADLPFYDYFRVLNPDTLAEVPFETRLRLFYTERGLYIGIWAEQPPETLISRLSSRDKFVSRDGFSLTIDPSGDGLYGYWFGINLGGSLSDGTVLPERQFSNRWDGAWRGASAVHDEGYSVEYFLPFTMMTMPEVDGDTRRMAFYLSRRLARKGETWGWPALPRSQPRYMSALQPIVIDNFKPTKQFTFYPYASTTYDVIAAEDDYKAGFDIFWRPSSNLQLTATANPDFGNIESDNVVVNLTSFETFFPEKRPFFLEGQEIFATTPRARPRFGGGTPTILVHTRRIGGPPRDLDIDDLELTDIEEYQPTELTGAAKITGQQGKWRYGAMTAVEDDTKIEGTINDLPVDLLQDGRTFGVARLLYESTNSGSRSGVGWISTLVDHSDGDAIVHGIDGHYLSSGGIWNFDGQLLYSDVEDVTGAGGFVDATYTPRQGLRHKFTFDYFNDDLDINDFGFLRRNDAIAARYELDITESGLDKLKKRETELVLTQEYNTDGLIVRSGIFFSQERIFKNNNFLYTELNYFPSRWDDLNSFGNGAFRVKPRWHAGAFWASDNSEPLQLGFGYFYQGEDIGGSQIFYEAEINWRPNDRFSAHLFLQYRTRTDWLVHDTDSDFTTFKAEFWQPRIEFDYFLSAKQQIKLSVQWVGVKADERHRWQIPTGDGLLFEDTRPVNDSRDFSISSMSFQARYRWEIAPLSDLFVVYTRGSDLPSHPEDSFDDLLRDSWTDRVADILVIKLRYRLGS